MLGGNAVLSSFFELVGSVLTALPSYEFFIALFAVMFIFGFVNIIKSLFNLE